MFFCLLCRSGFLLGAVLVGAFGSARRVALTPSPSPTVWEKGEPHADIFGVLKRSFSIRRKLRFRTP